MRTESHQTPEVDFHSMAAPKYSDTIAFGVLHISDAVAFYQNILGHKLKRQGEDWAELEMGGSRLILLRDGANQPVFELKSGDVETTVEFMEHHGCLLQDNFTEATGEPVLRDPFGYLWLVTKG